MANTAVLGGASEIGLASALKRLRQLSSERFPRATTGLSRQFSVIGFSYRFVSKTRPPSLLSARAVSVSPTFIYNTQQLALRRALAVVGLSDVFVAQRGSVQKVFSELSIRQAILPRPISRLWAQLDFCRA